MQSLKKNFFLQQFKTVWQFSWLLIGLIVIRFWPLVFQGKTLFFGDNYSLMVPSKLMTTEWLKQGIIPWWNPYNFGGISMADGINQSFWHPSTLAFLWLSPAVALNLTILVQIFIAGLGGFLLVRKITLHQGAATLAGIWWAFSTQVSGTVNNLSTLQSLVWLPWIILGGLNVSRRAGAKFLFAVLVLFQFVGGYPQHVLFSILAAVILSAYQEFAGESEIGLTGLSQSEIKKSFWPKLIDWGLAWLLTAVVTVGLTAFLWWPFLETLGDSTRETQTLAQSQAGSLHPSDLIKLVVPYFFDNPVVGMKWGPQWNGMPNLSLYFGWIGLVLPVSWLILRRFSHWDKFMLGVILVSLLFSLGGNLPGFEQLQAILPLLKVSRGPSTILMVTNIFWIIWLGSLLARDWPKPKLWQKYLIWLGLVVSLGSALAYYLGLTQFDKIWQLATSFLGPKLTQSPFHTLAKDQIIWQQIFKSLAINAGLFAAASWLWQRRWWVGLALVVAGDMLINTAGLYYFAPSEIYFTANQLKQFPAAKFASDWQFRTLIRNGNYPYTDLGAYWEAIAVRPPFSDSYVNAAELENYGYLSRFARGLTPDWNQVVGLSAVNGYVTLLPQSVQQTWAPAASSARINNLPEISLNNPALKTWAVKYYLVDHWFAVSEDLTGLKKIASQDWWDVYELPGVLARVRWLKADQTAEVSNWQENPNQISFSVKSLAHQPEALILADRYDKNWRAWVDDQVVSITNVADQRQILVPPGLHHVKFEFIPFRLYQGAAISGLTLFLALSLLVCLAKRR